MSYLDLSHITRIYCITINIKYFKIKQQIQCIKYFWLQTF